jgi:threonine aldolase
VLVPSGGVALCGRRAHVVVREAGAAGLNAGAQLVTLDDADGTLDPAEVARAVADARVGWAAPVAVLAEDTHGEVGGRVWPIERLQALADVGVPLHLDGARIWNAAVASGCTPAVRATGATTVSACLSKGLGAPIGSLLAGPRDLVAAARVERKRLGGGMRQVGILAAAGLVALGRIDRLAEDHARARVLADAAAARWPGSIDLGSVHTNIVRFTVGDPAAVLRHLADQGVLAVPGSATVVRLVTHADVDDADVERAVAAIASAPEAA